MSKLRNIPYWILNLVLFKGTWLLLVLGQNEALPYAIVLQGLSLWLRPARGGYFPQVMLVALFGILLDYMLSLTGVFVFPGNTFPAWLALLWLAFALALGEGFVFLHKLRLPFVAIFGLLFGPLGYWVGYRADAVDFSMPMTSTLLLLSILWALLLPGALLALRQPLSPKAATLVVLAVLMITPVVATAPAKADTPGDELRLIGQAKISFFFRPVYEAYLFAQNRNADFPLEGPFKLSLHYRLDITSRQLLRETLRQWEAQRLQPAQEWLALLQHSLPDIKSGDSLALETSEGQPARLLFNDVPIATIDDPEFVIAFSGIWLAENSTRPDLRKQLLGLTR